MKTLAFTSGDINGIGPEICIKSINKIYNPGRRKIILFCPENVFESAASIIKPQFSFRILNTSDALAQKKDEVLVISGGKAKINAGVPTKMSGKISFESVLAAHKICVAGIADAMLTAPISKTAFQLAGIKYPGHTELLAELSRSKKYLMVFLSKKFICGLVTIHEPVSKISRLISIRAVRNSAESLFNTLKYDLGIREPKMAVLGLNPHAGENGKIGKEEIKIISPAIRSFGNKNISGPFVPDAFFATHSFKNYNAVLGMYHDQVLIPFKMMNFNAGVNFTAGLNIVRTSPDHGTAFDIAWKNLADAGSMIESVVWAEKIISNRRKKIDAR